jgi:hypothetical protein
MLPSGGNQLGLRDPPPFEARSRTPPSLSPFQREPCRRGRKIWSRPARHGSGRTRLSFASHRRPLLTRYAVMVEIPSGREVVIREVRSGGFARATSKHRGSDDRESMTRVELLQQSEDGDCLRSVEGAVLQILMEADVERLIAAGRHECTAIGPITLTGIANAVSTRGSVRWVCASRCCG